MKPTDLPIEACIDALRMAMAGPGVGVLQAEPGAGKTTIVPLRLLEEDWVGKGKILMLEPRRLATRAAATRMASLLGEPVGRTVGYVTRDDRNVSDQTRIEVVTEGILTRRLQNDPELTGIAIVIFDEFHERSLQADLGLALALDVRRALRADLRILVMSATLDTQKVAELLAGGSPGGSAVEPAPIISAAGRTFPVDIRWKPKQKRDWIEPATADAVRVALKEPGDVLVFLPGAASIRRTSELLRGATSPDGQTVDVRPLFGALSAAEQDAAISPAPAGHRKVVLSTDIAETSLTVEGVRTVVDSGQVKDPQFDPRTGMTRLLTGAHSQASAEQRAGRAGRVAPGVAIRLWSKMEHASRPKFTAPEITRVDVSGLLLELGAWGVSNPADLPFLDLPSDASLAEARDLLAMLGALDDAGRLSTDGHAMSRLPLHPRLARMVIGAKDIGVGGIGCVLAALLEDRDVMRGRPGEVSADLGERIELVLDRNRRHPQADRGALHRARDRSRDIARRAGISDKSDGFDRATRQGADLAGAVLALAYPDRIAQQRGRKASGRGGGSQGRDGTFRLRTGSGAVLGASDPLASEEMLVVADLDGKRNDARIRLAAATDKADIVVAFGDEIEEVATMTWDPNRDDLIARIEQRLGALRLGSVERRPDPGPLTTAALLQRVRDTKLEVLGWSDRSRGLRHRLRFLHKIRPDEWPDLSDAALLGSLDDWLAPFLDTGTGRKSLRAVDLHTALWNQIGYHRQPDVDRLTPTHLAVAGGRDRPIDYSGERPTVGIRVQHLFGTTVHPTIVDGGVPIVLELLSPADRPIQITADLPGFWQGTWADVKKDLAGRYPKHSWPVDPATSEPPKPRRRR